MFNNAFKGKKVLITGNTGFKGSWLSLWLSDLGADVYGYGLPVKDIRDNYSVCNLSNIVKHLDSDIRDYEALLSYFKKIKPEIVFHLAAQPLVLKSYDDPIETYTTNVIGTVNVLECVRLTSSVEVALNITSDKCYKNNEWCWGYRENDALGGKDPYSASKSASEIITKSYISSFFSNLDTPNIATVRAGNVIGAGDWSADRIVPDYFRARIQNKEIVLRHPNSTRPWQHVLEPLSGYLALASNLLMQNKEFQGCWNFGPLSDSVHSVNDLINQLQIYDRKVKIRLENINKPAESISLKLDISKAISMLDWVPLLSFEQSVQLTAQGYINDLNLDSSVNNRLDTINFFVGISSKKKIKWSNDTNKNK
jgi:CDP-glucose 4,6-dehydratase